MQRNARMRKELELLAKSPPHGISCWAKEGKLDQLGAQIIGASSTPYENHVFKLEITIPERYPFEPPKFQFVTPIYHPNIDSAGRICLDSLKMPPKGAWKPSLNISTLLTTVQLLMSEPNPDDPLMADIANEYKYNRPLFMKNAKEWTQKHAEEAKTNVTTCEKGKKRKMLEQIDWSSDSDSSSEEEGSTCSNNNQHKSMSAETVQALKQLTKKKTKMKT